MTARNVQSQTKRRYCMDNLKTLREICNILEVTRRAVQGYEKAGLVTPSERNKYGYLLYNEIEQERIKNIKLYQQFGFKLKEIKDLIDAPEYVVKEAVERQVSKLRSEITRLSTLIDRAEGLIEEFIK